MALFMAVLMAALWFSSRDPAHGSFALECSQGPTIGGRIALTPWGESVMLAKAARGELIVSLDELLLLDGPEAECRPALGNVSDYLGPRDDVP